MTNRNLVLIWAAKVSVFGNEPDYWGIETLEPTTVERDAGQQRNDALGNRFHVVQGIRVMRYDEQRCRSVPVVPGEVLLVDEHPISDDDNPVRIGSRQLGKAGAGSADQLRVECLLRGRRNWPTIG